MNLEETAIVIAYVEHNWPNTPMSDGRADIFKLELEDLDFDVVQRALRGQFAAEEFPPTPAKLRLAVLHYGKVVATPQDLMAELFAAIEAHGWTGDKSHPQQEDGFWPEPRWSHPAIGEFVERNGGWREVCYATRELNGDTTQMAQYREHFKVLIVHADQEAARAALAAAPNKELQA